MFVPVRGRAEGRLLIRTSGPAEPLQQTVMGVAREEARVFPLTKIGTLAQADRMRRGNRMGAFRAMAGCATIVLMFAAIGLYAMLSIAVGQRRREIGIRVALGARARQVVLMFFAGGVRVTLLGLGIGLPLSVAGLAVVRRASGLSWVQVPFTAALVTAAVLGVGALASWLPARCAATVDPMVALRTE